VTPESIHQRDVWHVLHECQKVQGRIERALNLLHEQTPKVERNAQRVAAGQKPRGRTPKTDPIAHRHDVQRMEYTASSLKYLSCQLQRLLGVVVLKDQSILDSRERQEELDTLLELFFELCEETPQSVKKEIEGLLRHVQGALAGLTGFCPTLDSVQEQAALQLGEQACHLIGWAWLHRAILGPESKQLAADFPPAWQPTVLALMTAWDQAARASSIVENWHSILRPHLAVHRALSADLLAILALYHNHQVAPRGLHKGQSPRIACWFHKGTYRLVGRVGLFASHLSCTSTRTKLDNTFRTGYGEHRRLNSSLGCLPSIAASLHFDFSSGEA
jgi:hypothetical protein